MCRVHPQRLGGGVTTDAVEPGREDPEHSLQDCPLLGARME